MRATRRLLLRSRHIVARETLGRWRAFRNAHATPALALDSVRRRLELLLAGMYGRPFRIEALPAPKRISPVVRVLSNQEPRHLRGHVLQAESDGGTVRLPPRLNASQGEQRALARYRMLAFEQAERTTRGTAHALALGTDALERDLVMIRESAAVDAAVVETSPGVADMVRAARAEALARRTNARGLRRIEQAVERFVRAALIEDRTVLPVDGDADSSLAWARHTAAQLRASYENTYRGIAPVEHWGRVVPRFADGSLPRDDAADHPRPAPNPYANVGGLPWHIEAYGTGDSDEAAPHSADPSQTPMQDDRGKLVPMRSDSAGAAAKPEDVRDAPPGHGAIVELDPLDEASREVDERDASLTGVAVEYAEWDEATDSYKSRAVTVRECHAELGDESWAEHLLADQAPLVRRIRERFEPLRARRLRESAQRDGDELDVAAVVRALVEERTGHSADDRLYVATRPARRGLAIALLVDVSGSTDTHVDASRQVIDVEKSAVLLASEALDALGDPYCVLTFASKGARDVRLSIVKDFGERNGAVVRRRVAAMRPEGNTRLGAAIRHATALLEREPAGRRLLLVLSDGKPNDVAGYQGDYAVEDSRQSIAEARARGVYPFCLTIDRDEPEYMSHIFGRAGYTVMRRPELLPEAVLAAVRGLLRA